MTVRMDTWSWPGDDRVGLRVLQELVALGVPVRAVAVTGDAPAPRGGRAQVVGEPAASCGDRHQSRPCRAGAPRRAVGIRDAVGAGIPS